MKTILINSIKATQHRGGVEIDTTHTLGGLVRFDGKVVIERADIRDVIRALELALMRGWGRA